MRYPLLSSWVPKKINIADRMSFYYHLPIRSPLGGEPLLDFMAYMGTEVKLIYVNVDTAEKLREEEHELEKILEFNRKRMWLPQFFRILDGHSRDYISEWVEKEEEKRKKEKEKEDRIAREIRWETERQRAIERQNLIQHQMEMALINETVEECVYFIRSGEEVKIGQTINFDSRISSYKTQTPGLIVIGILIGRNRTDERELHNKFSSLSLHGEWFKLTGEIKEYLNDEMTDHEINLVKIYNERITKGKRRAGEKRLHELVCGQGPQKTLISVYEKQIDELDEPTNT